MSDTAPSGSFRIADDGVDPGRIPSRVLAGGARMPAIGLGTFGSDRYGAEEVAQAVLGAVAVGYRHIDCAAVYGNEAAIGGSLRTIQRCGVSRQELWITSKLWNDRHAEGEVIPACQRSLRDLQLEYLDLYLVHWPFPNHHPPGCDVTTRSPHARAYIHEEFMRTWRQMERLVDLGLVRHVGTSNMTIPKLELLLRDARVKPVCNQMELHPHFQQPELFRWIVAHGIVPVGYSPLGSPGRPERDRTPADSVDTEDPVIAGLAEKLRITPAAVCIKWAVQRGQVPIPFSVKRHQYLASLQAAVGPPLSAADMEALSAIDRRCRLIKGQVFLWKEGQRWEDLWDPAGEITPP